MSAAPIGREQGRVWRIHAPCGLGESGVVENVGDDLPVCVVPSVDVAGALKSLQRRQFARRFGELDRNKAERCRCRVEHAANGVEESAAIDLTERLSRQASDPLIVVPGKRREIGVHRTRASSSVVSSS